MKYFLIKFTYLGFSGTYSVWKDKTLLVRADSFGAAVDKICKQKDDFKMYNEAQNFENLTIE